MDSLKGAGLKLAHLNVGSLLAANKFEMFKEQVESSGVDIFGISESWLTESIPDNFIKLKGYNIARLDRSWRDDGRKGDSKRGGGLVCYTRNSLQVWDTKYNHLNCSSRDIEMHWLEVRIPNLRSIVVLNVYRPPQGDYKAACKIISESIVKANLKHNAEMYLMGDFNINLLDKSSPQAKELLFVTGLNGLSAKITKATRVSFRNGLAKETCIDQIFTNSSLVTEPKTLDLNISDHMAVFVRRKKSRVHSEKIRFRGRSYRNFVREDFQNALTELNWDEFYQSTNPEQCWVILEEAIRNVLDAMCPLKDFRVKEIREPWITDEILEEINDKDHLLKIAKATGNEEDWKVAKVERNRVGKMLRNAKAEFVKEQQRELSGDPRKFWKSVSTIVPGKKQHQGSINLVDHSTGKELSREEVPNHINQFFSSIGAKLAINNNENWKFFGEKVDEDCPELRTDYEQVLKLCKEINTTKSSGIQDISSKVFKSAFMVLVPHLVYMFNLSFSLNTFPDCWKKATVIPLFKSGDRTDVSNYRPISLLPLPGKLIEKIVHKRVLSFLEARKVLSEKQNGFRSGYSTTTAVADLTDDFFSAINNNEVSLSVFVDLRKAFDTVCHTTLCKKIEKYGIRGNVRQWCKSYLEHRTQLTLANNCRSDTGEITYGVPQGSVLGPLFFILYVNDLQQAIPYAKIQLYADDTVLYVSGSDKRSLETNLQLGLNCLNRWCRLNKLTINASKTKMMSFGTRHAVKKIRGKELFLDGSKIQSVSTFKYLGFTLDSTLTFRAHISDVIRKVMHKKVILSKIMPFLTKNTALSIYKSMILPYFDYCDEIYQTACKNDLDKLQRLQNKCLKTCLNLHKLCETRAVHMQAKCVQLESRRKAHISNFMFKKQSRVELMDNRDICTRQHDAPLFLVKHPSKESFKRSVQFSGPTIWNNLPPETRLIREYSCFKSLQKRQMTAA